MLNNENFAWKWCINKLSQKYYWKQLIQTYIAQMTTLTIVVASWPKKWFDVDCWLFVFGCCVCVLVWFGFSFVCPDLESEESNGSSFFQVSVFTFLFRVGDSLLYMKRVVYAWFLLTTVLGPLSCFLFCQCKLYNFWLLWLCHHIHVDLLASRVFPFIFVFFTFLF